MPHLAIQHSTHVTPAAMAELCGLLHGILVETGLYPLGGIRVRSLTCAAVAIADQHPENAFVDMIFRIATGRSEADKKMTGDKLMACAKDFFADTLARPHFALSLEIIEIDPVFSWKVNSMHNRMKVKT